MDQVRASAPQLEGLVPYDPKYLPADAFLSANENPCDVDLEIRQAIAREIEKVPFNRYPDPLANDLRDIIAEANGLDREQVLVGNGGDELLFNMALAWGGPGRKFLNIPPTFSVYAANARLTGTEVVNIPRLADYSIDEEAVLERVSQGDIDFVIITSPNNPTGMLVREEFLVRLLESTDALVMVDEAYYEFSRFTMVPRLAEHKNLVLLRTFSKAYSLAGVRIGYILAHQDVIREFIKVRQPYSVDAVSQVIARVVYENRAKFEAGIEAIIAERGRMMEQLEAISGVRVYPSDSNYILLKLDGAAEAWEYLYSKGILVRDFSKSAGLEGSLRVSIGTVEQNDAFLNALREFVLQGGNSDDC